MDEEMDDQPDIQSGELPGLNPDPMDVQAAAREAADEAAGRDVREEIRDVIDVPIADMIGDAMKAAEVDDDEVEQDEVADVPIDDMADDAADDERERPKHLGADPKAIMRARQARAADAKKGKKSPRRTGKQKDAWLEWYRMSQGMPPDAGDDESDDVPVDDLTRPQVREPVARASDRKNDIDVAAPQGNDKELNDQVVEMLRRYLDQERAWKRSLLHVLEQALQQLVSDHSRLEQIEAAFERGRESY